MHIPRWILSRRVALISARLPYILIALTIIFSFLFVPACKSKQQSPDGDDRSSVQAPPDSIELLFVYGSEKERWINEVTDKFNREDHHAPGGKRIFVRAIPMGSGECIDEVLNGIAPGHIWSVRLRQRSSSSVMHSRKARPARS